jgi:hypothetical protein
VLGKKYQGLHEMLELKQKKLTFSEEFAVFDFLNGYKLDEGINGSHFEE